ncbi:hypothetical protein [Ornithinibacillus halophilus]|uniref:Uncharacterized protein n=1 Tax=Ornithinibacillus halophilus TaxID=930117 RepID=A0A1M5EVX6_9BACI|nr:hypothetical protein [Ornithinibacillus halophilus]SHF83395.1 hypothetical protein SAMN05216225_100664 [Ornithinibacillus halophilus]
MKFLVYQVIAIGVIWLGMSFFFNQMSDSSKLIYYIVSSWLLFLIVLLVKEFIRSKKNKE